MKLLLIAPLPPPAGGIQSVTQTLCDFVAKMPIDLDLEILNTTHKLRPVTSESLPIRLFTGLLNSMHTYREFRNKIGGDKPTLVHLASSASLALIKDLLILRAAAKSRTPVVMHWHFGRIPALKKKQNWEWKLLLRVIRQSSSSIVIDVKSFRALTSSGCTNITYIPNPIPSSLESKTFSTHASEQKHTGRKLLFVGHIIRDKGVFELVKACSETDFVDELTLVGPCDASIQAELIAISRKRDEGKWLFFTGELEKEQVLLHMSKSPILALPSYTEGFPMVVIEALAMGCAVIATDVGAIPEILAVESDQPCGICVPPRNSEKLKKAIAFLTEHPDYLAAMRQRGVNRVRENYRMDKVFEQYRAVWQQATVNAGQTE